MGDFFTDSREQQARVKKKKMFFLQKAGDTNTAGSLQDYITHFKALTTHIIFSTADKYFNHKNSAIRQKTNKNKTSV